ncbi:unnamed protein product [Amaranthus hypochondriacus]
MDTTERIANTLRGSSYNCFNHASYIDPIFFFYELFPTTVASDFHDSMPLAGAIIRAMQVIYVNRFSPSSRKNAVNEMKQIILLFLGFLCFQHMGFMGKERSYFKTAN